MDQTQLMLKYPILFLIIIIQQVKPKRVGSNWTRRDITLKDKATDRTVTVKLWNTMADAITETNEGDTVQIKNVEVDIFREQVQLKSLDTLTEVTVSYQNSKSI